MLTNVPLTQVHSHALLCNCRLERLAGEVACAAFEETLPTGVQRSLLNASTLPLRCSSACACCPAEEAPGKA